MFASRLKMPKRPLNRALTRGFERFEDRSLMSATPVTPAGLSAGDDPDSIDETFALQFMVSQRAIMQDMYSRTAAAAAPQVLGTAPFAEVVNNRLAVVGTNGADTIKVQEYPAVYAQNGRLVKDAEYFVKVTSVVGRKVTTVPYHFKLNEVPIKSVFIYGLGDKDHIEFLTTVAASQTVVDIDGGAGVDDLTGGPNGDFLDGGLGDASKDTLHGGKGGDILVGGAGDDLLFGEDGTDLMFGEAGKDTMRGGSLNDELFGGPENDTMFGDSENDALYGGTGVDTLNGEGGIDYLSGGQDNQKDVLVGGTQGDYFRIEGTVANNKDKPRKFNKDEGDKYVTSRPAAHVSSSAANVGWLALDASFAEVGGGPTTRRLRRV
jgi:Ca2+-binding RTX toxin-like protein